MTYVPEIHWGDGSDGNVTITSDTDLNGVAMQYNNLTINAGVKLYDSTGFLKIFVRNRLVINGSIDQTGYGAVGGAAGTPATYKCNDYFNGDAINGGSPVSILSTTGGAGGARSAISGSAGSAPEGTNASWGSLPGEPAIGEVPTTEILDYINLFNPLVSTHPGALTIRAGAGGAGGGAGSAWLSSIYESSDYDAGAAGGAGGNGGGMVVIFAKSISGTGTIKADGLAGSAGVANVNSTGTLAGGSGGGGGGGSGGYLRIYTKQLSSVTTSVAGASGGAAAMRDDNNDAVAEAWSSAGEDGTAGIINIEYWR